MARYRKEKAIQLTKHFKSTEFDCKGSGCCRETIIDAKLLTLLQKIRSHFNKPVIINSGYRCATHNRKVGGSSGSKHKYGKAADIVVKGVSPRKVAQYAESIDIKGIGLYDTFTHIDTRTTKYYWYSHKQERRYTFKEGGGGVCRTLI